MCVIRPWRLQIFRPALHKSNPYLSVPYFVVFMFLGVWLLMGLLLAVIVEQFRCERRRVELWRCL